MQKNTTSCIVIFTIRLNAQQPFWYFNFDYNNVLHLQSQASF